MIARMGIEKPDDINVTLTITMPLREWKAIRRQQAETYPSWQFARLIGDCVDAIDGHIELERDEVRA